MDIIHGSNRLESISNYGLLANFLLDCQTNIGESIGLGGILGTGSSRVGVDINATERKSFCLPVISGCIGTMAEKFWPLSTSDDLRVEFTLASAVTGMVAKADTYNDWTVTGVTLELSVIELDSVGMNALQNSGFSFSDNIYIHGTTFSSFTSNIVSGATGPQSHLISAKCASLKAIFTLPQRSANITNDLVCSTSCRVNPNITDYSYKVGMYQYPQKQITLSSTTTGGYSEGLIELLKCFHPISSTSLNSSFSRVNYNCAHTVDDTCDVAAYSETTAYATHAFAFAIGVDLQTIAGRDDVIMSGISTQNSNTFFDFIISSTGVNVDYTLTHFSMYDVIYVLNPYGQYEVRY
jgi:hypothetical protein